MLGILFIITASLVLLAPMFSGIFPYATRNLTEQRTLAERPDMHPIEVLTGYYQYKYEQYLNDTFGLRDVMVQAMTTMYLDFLGTSPIERVIVGRDQWLFLNDNNLLQDTLGVAQYTSEQLEQFREIFVRREQYAASVGIPYVYVVVPNKTTVYPDKLPFDISTAGIRTKTDQLIDVIRTYTTIPVIDLRPVLIAARTTTEYPLYIPTDTHWQPIGAHIAYQHVLGELQRLYPDLFATVTPLARTPDPKVASGGDVARMLNQRDAYQDPFILMPRVQGEAEPTTRTDITAYKNPSLSPLFAYEQPDASLPRALIVRDSFGDALIPFISEPFSRTAFVWTPFVYDYIVEAESPDIILQFMVERLQHELLGEPRVSGGI